MAIPMTAANKDMLVVQNLKTYFPVRAGVFQRVVAHVKAVDDVSFTVREGETFGLSANRAVAKRPSPAPSCGCRRRLKAPSFLTAKMSSTSAHRS
jgi:hypothetical protein